MHPSPTPIDREREEQSAALPLAPSTFVTLWRLARRRIRSEADYRRFQTFQARLLLAYLARWEVELAGRTVLDLGSGIGGYTTELGRFGARVIALDRMVPSRRAGAALVADALSVPLAKGSIDFIFCASLIEHVDRPERLLAEIERVLAPGGYCYLSFPPYFSPLGGHEFSPWHYLGERWALRLSRRRREKIPAWVRALYRPATDPDSFAHIYPEWGLYPMTIGKARRLIAAGDLHLVDMSTRYLPWSAVRWPLLGELLTWHAQFLLRKPHLADPGARER